jgi:PAS domain S-box-containing protein
LPSEKQDLKQAVIAHKRSEANLRLGIAVAGFGLGVINYRTDQVTLDDTAAALFALPANTPMARADLHARFHPDCAARLEDKIRQALDPAGDGVLAVEHRVLRPDGSIIWVAARKQIEFGRHTPNGSRVATDGLLAVRDISNRRLAEKQMRISELRYRRLFEAAHDGVVLVDPVTAKIVDANPFMIKLLGYSHTDLVGKELFEIGLLKDKAASQEMFEKLKTDYQVRYDNLPLKSQKGAHRDVEVVANLYDEGGHAIIQCNIRDITERKLAEAAVLQNSQLFSTLIEQAPSGVYVIDALFKMSQINQLALPFFASVTPLLGRDFSEILTIVWGQAVGAKLATIFRHTLQTGKRYVATDFTERRQDIDVVQSYDWEAQRITLADGTYGVACYFNDVTARKHAEEVVVEREAHVRSILDNTQAFIGLLSVDGTLLEANVPALAAAGIARDRVIGRKLWDTNWWAQDSVEAARLKDAVLRSAAGEVVRYDMIVRLASAKRIDVDFMLAPVRDASGTITLLVPSGLDITERKRSMHHIQQLMGEVNHRAMNLLGVVQAVARQTARDGDPATFVTRLTERIGGLAASQDLLVRNEWKGVEVKDLVAAQLAHYKGLFGSHVVFDGPPARLTPAAAQGIGMALHELATNASKYGALSDSVGRVTISWRVTDVAEPTFEMRWVEDGGPPVVPPTRNGFGQKVIGPMAEAAISGRAKVQYLPRGLAWTLIAPVAETLESGREAMPLAFP